MKNIFTKALGTIVLIYVFVLAPSIANSANKGITFVEKRTISNFTRKALIIGNSDYKSSPLRNPVNDATAIADILRSCGFKVTTGFNLTQAEMKKSISIFGNSISVGSVALFYYSGHGMQVNGSNYLIPIDAKIVVEDDVDIESVNVNRVLTKMASVKMTTNILILDACRDSPFYRGFRSKQNGLAYMNAPTGTIISYSTAPGSIASDGDGQFGMYTEELINNLLLPDTKIEDVFKRVRIKVAERSKNKQIPWESSSLMGDFYFSNKTTAPSSSNFGLTDLSREADETEQIKKRWGEYDRSMKLAFQDLQKYLERDVPKDKKIIALNRFIEAFEQNNPYSQDDNKVRENIEKLIEYWKNYKQITIQEKVVLEGMTIDEVRTILGKEQSFDDCSSHQYLFYNDRWIWASSGIVKGYIPIGSWKGPCHSASYASNYQKFRQARPFFTAAPIRPGMSINEVRSILGKEQSFDDCSSHQYLFYNDRWIWASSGIVKGYIPIGSWKGPCHSASYASNYKKF